MRKKRNLRLAYRRQEERARAIFWALYGDPDAVSRAYNRMMGRGDRRAA